MIAVIHLEVGNEIAGNVLRIAPELDERGKDINYGFRTDLFSRINEKIE